MAGTNVETVKRFYRELMAHGRAEAADELLAPGYVDHHFAPLAVGPGAFTAWLGRFDSAFRNRMIVLEDVEEDGDYVAVRWMASMVHSGAYEGFAASGETIELTGTSVFRIEDGRIAERWDHEAGMGLMDQLQLRSLGAGVDFFGLPGSLFEREPAVAYAH